MLAESIDDSPFYEQPFSCWVSIGTDTTIRDEDHLDKTITDLRVGSKVSVYTIYLVLESDPLKVHGDGDLIIISNE